MVSSCQVAQPAKLLIVAFAASQVPPAPIRKISRENSTRQGEPEWSGFLRRLLEKGKAYMDCTPTFGDVMMCCWQVTHYHMLPQICLIYWRPEKVVVCESNAFASATGRWRQ